MDKHLLFLACLMSIVSANAEQCQHPEIIPTSYTTRDATVLKQIAYISNFELKCKRGSVGKLYAYIRDAVVPVATVGPGKYQVSWTEDVKTARTGDVTIHIFNESGFAAAKKALRAGDDISTVPTFAQIIINHPGIFTGPWFSCEFLAVGLSIIIVYIAIHFKTKLLS